VSDIERGLRVERERQRERVEGWVRERQRERVED
jgi:hypothetical protein